MRILRHIRALLQEDAPVHLAMGFFDGVHLGHRRVIGVPLPPGVRRGVLTFERHPLAQLKPELQPLLLTPCAAQKEALLASLGVEVLLCLPFDAALSALSPADFLEALVSTGRVAGFSVGSNWRFGRGGAGTARFLADYAARRGLPVQVQDLVEIGGTRVCSSLIRSLVAENRLTEAAELLGRPFTVAGVVEHGQHLARTLGFPTANITVAQPAALPSYGVYEVQACVDGRRVRGIANLGVRPTIEEERKVVRLETHFVDFSADLYGKYIDVELWRFLRPERRFRDVAELRKQIEADLRYL